MRRLAGAQGEKEIRRYTTVSTTTLTTFCSSLHSSPRVPFIMDPNTENQMGESADIVEYLYRQYGDGKGGSRGPVEANEEERMMVRV